MTPEEIRAQARQVFVGASQDAFDAIEYVTGLMQTTAAPAGDDARDKLPKPYNEAQIAWELERTAMGDGFYGNALRVAKDLPYLTADHRALLDRYATGCQSGTDHVALQDLALLIDAAMKGKP